MDGDWFTSLEETHEDGGSQRSDNFIKVIYAFINIVCKCDVLL